MNEWDIVVNMFDTILNMVKILDDRIIMLEEKNPKQDYKPVNRLNLKIDLMNELKQVIKNRGEIH